MCRCDSTQHMMPSACLATALWLSVARVVQASTLQLVAVAMCTVSTILDGLPRQLPILVNSALSHP
jgi:hypothetical protein